MAGFDARYFAYGSAGLALLGAMGAFVGGGGIISLFAGLFCLIGAAGAVGFYKYGYILIPLITQKGNIIQGFRAALSLEQIGYLYYKLLFTLKDLTVEKERAFLQYCRTNPHITQFIRYLGNWEIQIELEVPSEKRLFEIIEGLRNTFGDIIKTYDVLKLKEEKLDYYPFNLMPAAGRSP